HPPTPPTYTLSLHDALPISRLRQFPLCRSSQEAPRQQTSPCESPASGSFRIARNIQILSLDSLFSSRSLQHPYPAQFSRPSSELDRKSTRLNSSHSQISYAV